MTAHTHPRSNVLDVRSVAYARVPGISRNPAYDFRDS
jgi:hypothetical protein